MLIPLMVYSLVVAFSLSQLRYLVYHSRANLMIYSEEHSNSFEILIHKPGFLRVCHLL